MTSRADDGHDVTVRAIPFTAIGDYERVPIVFTVRDVADVRRTADGGFGLQVRPVGHPWDKNYDEAPDNRPSQWSRLFDVTNWQLFMAWRDGGIVGGAAVAHNTLGVEQLEQRTDLALLWDLRVLPSERGSGIGTALFGQAETWASTHGCRTLKVETQDVNVPACRFYASRGCTLRVVDPHAYPSHPDEIQLLWYKELTPQI